MEFKVEVRELSKALQRVQGIVEKKTTMPILANVLLEASADEGLRVSATNLELGHSGSYVADVAEPGSITLAGKSLYDIVRSLPEDQAVLKRAANNWVEISCGKVNYRVVGMSSDGYPALPSFSDVSFFDIDASAFRSMIERTLYSVCTDETRYNLTGVYCEPLSEGPGIRMVSTDGHRLSLVENRMDEAPPLSQGVIIPRKGIIEVKRLLEDGDGAARIGFADNSAIFERNGTTLTMQLVEGQFPDYRQVIPNSYSKSLKIPRAAFLAGLKRTSLLSPDKAQGVRLEASPGVLALSANNPDLGEAREELDIDYDGESLKIGFNFRYLIDVLQVIPDDFIEFQLTDPLSPGVLLGVGCETYRAVIMPMRL